MFSQPPVLALRVASARPIADDVLALTLIDAAGAALPLWTAGAHIDLVLPSGRVRQYSLCGARNEPVYRIAVLRERAGRGGSNEIHSADLVGGVLQARGPRNHFELVDADRYLFIAGGIGITPLWAMIQELNLRAAPWQLVYGGRTVSSMAFVDELLDIAPERVTLWPQDTHGLPDIPRIIGEAEPGTAVYCCGPEGLIRAVEDAFAARDDLGGLHLERFKPAAEQATARTDREFVLVCGRSGREIVVPANRSILDTVLAEVDGRYPHGCTEGVCGSCETRVLDGVPEHRDQVLTDEEKARHEVMMICVGRAKTERLVLDI